MQQAIVNTIASMLEAIPYQVELWDGKVIDCLVRDPHLLHRFHAGGKEAQWHIYYALKYSEALQT